jgi:hypothetical protein
VHVRHLRNLHMFRWVARHGLRGRLEYPRQLLLLASAQEVFSFAVLFAAIFMVTGSYFVLGGVFSCLLIASQHRAFAQRHISPSRPGDRSPLPQE